MTWAVFSFPALCAPAIAQKPMQRAQSVPLRRSTAVPVVLTDQIEKVDRDLRRSLISGARAEAACQEISHREVASVKARSG